MDKKTIIAYDNTCNFCTSAKIDVEKIDRKSKLKWVGIKNFDNKKYKLSKAQLLKEMHLIDGNNIYKGYYAWKQIAKRIPLMYPFYLLSLIPGVDYMGSLVYRWISKHRNKI